MKTLYIYSDKTGLKRSEKKDARILRKLTKIFPDITPLKTKTLDELEKAILETPGNYDNLIISGGDGTLKFAVNVLMKIEKSKRPILGYLPTGTVNDAGKAFGCGNTIRTGLKNLSRKVTTNIDLVKVNDQYINFVVAIGAYTDISYSTKRGSKKILGRMAYYFDALPNLFKKKVINAHVEADGKVYDVKTPFILVMNSRNVGGFPVNFKYSINDGMVDVFITKPGLFNGLLHYAFFKVKTLKLQAKHLHISTDTNDSWCYDGEEGEKGDVTIDVLHNELKVFGKSK